MNLLHTLSILESNDDLHLGRLLILLWAFAGKKNDGAIEGLTKLAKLDFLLRYPVYLEKALEKRKQSTQKVETADHERKSVESKMVRYRYGPWDFRYRKFINTLVGKGLVNIEIAGKTIQTRLTQMGWEAANQLSKNEAYLDITRRAKILKTHFDVKGTYLMKFIYETFPEIVSLSFGQEIRS